MTSAFYIVMGGYAYDISDLSDDYSYLALTPFGFMEFVGKGFIRPDILNNDEIADRSKADSLGKLLVCVQALWMVVNCIYCLRGQWEANYYRGAECNCACCCLRINYGGTNHWL
jgi:hypothetical protein